MTRQRQVERLNQVKRERNPQEVTAALANLKKTAVEGENLMPPLIRAVRSYATLSEMVGILKETYGTYSAPTGI
jgi:methylmalonyl-CoA mutase N-terminal domain/subunit